MENIKRYFVTANDDPLEPPTHSFVDEDGDWVKYEDIEELVKQEHEKLKTYRKALYFLWDFYEDAHRSGRVSRTALKDCGEFEIAKQESEVKKSEA